jgi:radical SAM superfamily enzyme YgiQ (UPF0313 family)
MADELRGYSSVRTAFLQDADSLILPVEDLVAVLDHLKEKFPKINRITTYARARTLSHKSVDDLKRLKQAGLTRIHTGMESGSARVLQMIKKGITPKEVVIGGRHVMEAEIELSEYIMPGVAGRALSEEHATETARLLNLIRPHFIRVRTFAMHPQSPMQKMVRERTFMPLTDDGIVAEIRLLVYHLGNIHSYFSCNDFSLNLLMQVDGFLDEKKEYMLKELDAFLSMTKRQRQVYTLLHYAGYSRSPLSIVNDQNILDQVVPEIEKLERSGGEHGFDEYVQMLKTYQLPQPQTDNWC